MLRSKGLPTNFQKKNPIIGELDEPWERVGLEILHAEEENPSNTWTAKSFVWTEILRPCLVGKNLVF